MKNGIIVSTRYADELALLKLSASEIDDAWTEVIAFENGSKWGCFRISETRWFMHGLFDAPSVSVTCGPRKGMLKNILYGNYADWTFRLHPDGALVCSVKMGFGDGGYFVNDDSISFANSASGYFSNICDVSKPGFICKPWRIIAKIDEQELVAACFAYYFFIYASIEGFPVSV